MAKFVLMLKTDNGACFFNSTEHTISSDIKDALFYKSYDEATNYMRIFKFWTQDVKHIKDSHKIVEVIDETLDPNTLYDATPKNIKHTVKVYKLYFVDEEADETRQELFEGIQVLTATGLKKVCNDYVKEETILPHTFEAWKSDNGFGDVEIMDLPVDEVIDLLEYDGYSVEEIELPDNELK